MKKALDAIGITRDEACKKAAQGVMDNLFGHTELVGRALVTYFATSNIDLDEWLDLGPDTYIIANP